MRMSPTGATRCLRTSLPSRGCRLRHGDLHKIADVGGATFTGRADVGRTTITDGEFSALDVALDWFAEDQRAYLAVHGFVPGLFNMAIDTNVPEAAAAMQYAKTADDMLRRVLSDEIARRGLNGVDIGTLTDSIAHIISGVMIEARLANSMAPVETLKPLALRLVDGVGEPSHGVSPWLALWRDTRDHPSKRSHVLRRLAT
jgi:hypothetical protein